MSRDRELSRREFLQSAGVAGAGLVAGVPTGLLDALDTVSTAQFAVKFDAGAMVSLKRVGDAVDTEYIQTGRRLGDAIVRYRQGTPEWQTLETANFTERALTASADGRQQRATYRVNALFELSVEFLIEDAALHWRLGVQNLSDRPLEIGDLAVPLLMNSSFQQQPATAVLKHSFISGHGSHLFWMRRSSIGPYLTLTPAENTALEYWEAQGGYRVFIHSAASGAVARERGCKWRQPNTSLTLAPRGRAGSTRSYGFKLQWAADYQGVRQILVNDGLIDVEVVPGMTVPNDLFARFALRTQARINSVTAEFPKQTTIRALGRKGDAQIYEVRFARLGENRLTVNFGDDRHMFLEPTYFQLGSDYRGSGGNSYTLTYMSQMGGWAVLDYALHHSSAPASHLRLGYASILSAWALLNSGTPESNFGYWYPGQENDGGAGGGFEPAPYGNTWLEQPHHRGSWYYSCEIDLGFCGALRGACTVLSDDPLFGLFCFGGDLRTTRAGSEVVPKDGVRRRFHALAGDKRLHVTLANARFARGRAIVVNPALTEVQAELESDNLSAFTARVQVLENGRERAVEVPMNNGSGKLRSQSAAVG